MKIAVGFTIFLEHILPYERQEEKGVMKKPPFVQLGGGAWNIAKDLEDFGFSLKDILLLGISSKEESADRSAIRALLKKNDTQYALLPIKERAYSSYYLVPRLGKTWAFGDHGGKCYRLSAGEKEKVRNISKNAQIKILAEIPDDKEIVSLAELFFEKHHKDQISVLIPAVSLLRSSKIKRLIKKIDVFSLNKSEAELFFGKPLIEEKVLASKIPYIFITDGPGEVWLKENDKLHKVLPESLENPRFPAGAGDAATAALVYKLFIKKAGVSDALQFAIKIGKKTLQIPTSYLQKQ